MQRWLSILLGLGAVALAVAVVLKTMSDHPMPTKADAVVDAGPSSSATAQVADAAPPKDAAPKKAPVADAEDPFASLSLGDPAATPGTAGHFADGRPVPPLPEGAPKHIRLGIVLMTYAGAQGAPPTARPKKDALDLATKLASDAKSDFHAAVIRGDSGSSDDIGRMPRGVLDAPLEYMLFTMPVGTISDVLETPRGYWIAKRTE